VERDENIIKPADAADLAGVSEATIRRWVREDRLNKYTDGLGRMWVDRREVLHLITPKPVEAGA
jgi:predicted site-specific integrase-resolvase